MRAAATLAAAVRRVARPERAALVSPQQSIDWSYGELDLRSRSLAAGLSELGVKRGDAVVTDFPNTAENLVTQLALSHLGAVVASAKDAAAIAKLQDSGTPVLAALCATSESSLLSFALKLPPVILSGSATELWTGGGGTSLPYEELATCAPDDADPVDDPDALHGSYNGSLLSSAALGSLAADAARELSTLESDRVCVSISLLHAFGIGSAVGSALTSGATVVLPAVGGIRGCGTPEQRADVTLQVLGSTGATQLFADTHTLRALPSPGEAALALRTGVVKIGSGSDFLKGVTEAAKDLPLVFNGVPLHAMGKASATA